MVLSAQKDDLDEDTRDDKKTSLKAARGPLLSLGAAVFNALAAEFTALGSKNGVPGFQLLFFLRLAQLLILLVCYPIFRPKLIGENRWQNFILFLEPFVNNVATTLMFLSFTYAAPGIAYGIIQGAMPLFTACMGFIFLKEKVGLIPCCGILISVTGVALVSFGMAKLAMDSTHAVVLSILLPLAAAFAKAPEMVIARAIMKDMSGITMMLYVTLLGTVAQLVLTYSFETPVWVMSTETAGYVAGLGVSQAVSMLLTVTVLSIETAAIAVALSTLVVPFTIVLDYLILSKVPNVLKWAGLSLVLLGTIMVGIHTWWTHRQDEKRMNFRKRMDFSPLLTETE